MLYPEEAVPDAKHQEPYLIYKCRICEYSIEAKDGDRTESCVYSSSVTSAMTDIIVSKDISNDPTLART